MFKEQSKQKKNLFPLEIFKCQNQYKFFKMSKKHLFVSREVYLTKKNFQNCLIKS